MAAVAAECVAEGVLGALHDDFAERTKLSLTLWTAIMAAADGCMALERSNPWLNTVASVRSGAPCLHLRRLCTLTIPT